MASLEPLEEDIEMGEDLADTVNTKLGSVGGLAKGRRLQKQILDGACILLNITSTVVLVFLNKWYVRHVPGWLCVIAQLTVYNINY
jgi:hypothetical protein